MHINVIRLALVPNIFFIKIRIVDITDKTKKSSLKSIISFPNRSMTIINDT